MTNLAAIERSKERLARRKEGMLALIERLRASNRDNFVVVGLLEAGETIMEMVCPQCGGKTWVT